MISPCACVGTNQWVHEACLKTYCLQFLAANTANSPTLRVACPICKTEYQITSRSDGPVSSWRELFRFSSTDTQLLYAHGPFTSLMHLRTLSSKMPSLGSNLAMCCTGRLRHLRFFFLVAPLICSSVVAWSWLAAYWEDLYHNGPGEPLLEGGSGADQSQSQGPPLLRGALLWLPKFASQFVDSRFPTLFAKLDDAPPAEETEPMPISVHPAGISKNWSMLYVWLQYVQWYKVLCWLLVLVLGGSEGLLPQNVREAFRVEELLLASETRAQVFIFGQCVPFVLTKARHFLVTWAGASQLVRFFFYSGFTSHVEVASTLACDSVVTVRANARPPSLAALDSPRAPFPVLRRRVNRLTSSTIG